MRKILLIALFFFFSNFILFSQEYIQDYKTGKDLSENLDVLHASLGASSGINNLSGFFGLNAEYFFYKGMAVDLGVGFSTWGIKTGAGFSYHNMYVNNFYLRAAYIFAAGMRLDSIQLKDIQGNMRTYTVQMHAAHAGQIVVGKDWRVGSRKNRIFFEIGYTYLLNKLLKKNLMTIWGNYYPSNESLFLLYLLAPHGISIGFGFMFGR